MKKARHAGFFFVVSHLTALPYHRGRSPSPTRLTESPPILSQIA
jgi:hypothetical protein